MPTISSVASGDQRSARSDRTLPVWLVTGDLPPGFSGAGRNDLLLAGCLARHGILPTLVSHRLPSGPAAQRASEVPPGRAELQGIRVLRLARPAGAGKLLYPLELIARLALARPRPAVLRFRGFGLRRALCATACRRLFPKVAIAVQPACFGVDDPATLAATPWGGFKRRQLLAASTLLAMNRGLEESFADAGFPAERITAVRNPVDLERFAPAGPDARADLRRRLGLPASARVAVTAGGLSQRKGQAWITAAVADLMRREVDLHLMHVGPEADDLRRLGAPARRVAEARAVAEEIRRAAVDAAGRVRLTGLVPDAAPFLRAADLFLQASTREGEANVVNEAMACGLGCIIPASEVYERQVQTASFFPYRAADPAALEATVSEVLARPDQARRAGLRARRWMEETRSPAAVGSDYAAALVATSRFRGFE